MTDNEIGGYEWGWTCGRCKSFIGLSGMGYGNYPVVNGDSTVRTRGLDDGDTLECPECGYTVTLTFEE